MERDPYEPSEGPLPWEKPRPVHKWVCEICGWSGKVRQHHDDADRDRLCASNSWKEVTE